MSATRSYPVHNPDADHCVCWSCENTRRVRIAEAEEIKRRTQALATAADLLVIHVLKDVYEMQLGDRIVNGQLAMILRDPGPYERPVIDAFQGLPLLEQYELLQEAKKKKRMRVRDMKFSKDAEAEEAETERKRRGF